MTIEFNFQTGLYEIVNSFSLTMVAIIHDMEIAEGIRDRLNNEPNSHVSFWLDEEPMMCPVKDLKHFIEMHGHLGISIYMISDEVDVCINACNEMYKSTMTEPRQAPSMSVEEVGQRN